MKTKLYKCKQQADGCFGQYEKWLADIQMQGCCKNPNCVLKKTVGNREKKEARKRSKLAQEKKAGRERLMSISARLKRARETAFQVWVKLRDFAWFASIGKDPACIMCGNTNPEMWHACHFQSVGSKPELQLHPDNCHLGCRQCNYFVAQSDTQYEANLIKKIGLPRVEFLKNYNSTIRWDVEDIELARAYYVELSKELKE